MPTPQTLKESYLDELGDLWSANDQMQAIVQEMVGKTSDPKLRTTLEHSVKGIAQHTATLRQVIEANGGHGKEHCSGMEGLVREARRHALEAGAARPELADLAIIAQYQRMSHYGMAGFGTAAAYAGALGRGEDQAKLKQIVSDIYRGDEYGSRLAERLEQAAAG